MRLYARSLGGGYELRTDLTGLEPMTRQIPHPNQEAGLRLLRWHGLAAMIEGLHRRIGVELQLGSGSLYLWDELKPHEIYHVASGRDADSLRLWMYESLLSHWQQILQQDEISRTGLEAIEQLRCRMVRLQDSLARPDAFAYQFF